MIELQQIKPGMKLRIVAGRDAALVAQNPPIYQERDGHIVTALSVRYRPFESIEVQYDNGERTWMEPGWLELADKRRRYQNVKAARAVYVNSLGQYHLEVWYEDVLLGKTIEREYCWDLLDPLGVKAPAYLERECERLFLARLKDDGTRFYEFDRDGHKRYTGLRYYDPADVAAIIGAIERARVEAKAGRGAKKDD